MAISSINEEIEQKYIIYFFEDNSSLIHASESFTFIKFYLFKKCPELKNLPKKKKKEEELIFNQ